MNNKDDLRKLVNDFDEVNVVKQIILIGMNGKVRNIEFEIEDEDES